MDRHKRIMTVLWIGMAIAFLYLADTETRLYQVLTKIELVMSEDAAG
ncbi:MAG: hypothetical protein HFH41_03910 [Lachnospiraceae bacterium]|nr:hypothetical protein [Lachnospiraceae bacterium]